MSCFHPLLGLIVGKTESGKMNIKVLPSGTDPKPYIDRGFEVTQIPCRQCIGCRIDYSREWANRLVMELQYHDPDKCWFVTLTYDDFYVNDHCMVIGEDQKVHYSLVKRDLQLFMKRLRKYMPDKIRFYACGEYGEHTLRPHYHLILFNCDLGSESMDPVSKSKLGFQYFNSEIIRKTWKFGFNICAPVTWESCAYTARYMLKKLKGFEAEWYDYFSVERPFTIGSRKPGIGRSYFEDHKDLSEVSYWPVNSGGRIVRISPPGYFERLYEDLDPVGSENRKALKKALAVERQNLILSKTDLSDIEYRFNEEKALRINLRF